MKKTVLITGVSSGFGKETAKIFQKNGWNVIATMRYTEKEQELNTLENVLIAKLDVQDSDSIKNAVKTGIKKFGKIDALVNNAGYALMGVFESADLASLDILQLRGFLLCPNCGKLLTGSGSRGCGSRYYYYHYNSKCSARFKAQKCK
jgi:NAD(P)-dependent dehydrogenase (short-subunit alcohol dehydrogenase family)